MKIQTFFLLLACSFCGLKSQTYSISVMNVSGLYSVTCSSPSVHLVLSSNLPSPNSFSWAGPSALTGTNVNIAVPGNYTITATSGTISVSRTVSIGTYTSVPLYTVSPSTQTISCTNFSAQVVVVVSPSPSVTGTPATSLTHSIYTPNGAVFVSTATASFLYNASTAGTYSYVMVNNNNGCSVTAQFSVASSANFPTFSILSPQNFTLGCGTKSVATILFVNGTTSNPPGGPVAYGLLPPGSPTAIVPGPATTYTVNAAGVYTAVIRDMVTQCETRTPFSVVQNTAGPPLSVLVPTDVVTCNTPTVLLQAFSAQPVSFVWSFPGTPGVVPGNSIIATANLAMPTSSILANFTLTGTDQSSTCFSRSVIPVYQNVFPPKAIVSATGLSAITCQTPTVILTDQSISGIPSPGPFPISQPVVTWAWLAPGVGLPVISNTFTAAIPGIYTLTVKDLNNGCTSSTLHTVADYRDYPVLDGKKTLCGNFGPQLLTAFTQTPGGQITYSWSSPPGGNLSASTGNTVVATGLGIYTVTATNSANACVSVAQYSLVICEGLGEAGSEARFEFFPNPGIGKYTFVLKEKAANCTALLLDAQGRFICSLALAEGANSIDLSSQPAGIYSLMISAEDGSRAVKKVVKEQ